MRLHEHHREIAGVLALYGIRPLIEPTNGGHVRFTWKAGDRDQKLLTSKTPSDWRTRKNCVARVRRMLKAAGVDKINPCASVADHPRARPIAPSPTATIEARLAQLESDVQMLLDLLTNPAGPRPPQDAIVVDDAPKPKKRGVRTAGTCWLWPAMRYDDFMHVGDIAKAAGHTYHQAAVLLTFWKKKGFVEHKRGEGWRKHRKVEELDRATNGHANGNHVNGSAAH